MNLQTFKEAIQGAHFLLLCKYHLVHILTLGSYSSSAYNSFPYSLAVFPSTFLRDRFASLIDTPKGIEAFETQYNIPPGVATQHCLLGDWHALRPKGAMVIPMIAFIEGGMQIPMGRVTRDFLIAHRLCQTKCCLNLFRILGSVNAFNQKKG